VRGEAATGPGDAGRLVETGRVEVDAGDRSAPGEQSERDLASDAVPRAGDDEDLA
jgi:hypothetical protein